MGFIALSRITAGSNGKPKLHYWNYFWVLGIEIEKKKKKKKKSNCNHFFDDENGIKKSLAAF